jgi:CheY-like chemotaxis protein
MPTILLIDDDVAVRDVMRAMLEGADYQVVEASDGTAGVQMFHKHRPDAVLVDIFMPHQDGIETIRELRRLESGVKIVAVSGRIIGRVNLLKAAQELGADYGLKKPFKEAELLGAVARVLAASPQAPDRSAD